MAPARMSRGRGFSFLTVKPVIGRETHWHDKPDDYSMLIRLVDNHGRAVLPRRREIRPRGSAALPSFEVLATNRISKDHSSGQHRKNRLNRDA